MSRIKNEIKVFYINKRGELYCQHNTDTMKNLPEDIYSVGDEVKLVSNNCLISGRVIRLSKAGIYLTHWNIGANE